MRRRNKPKFLKYTIAFLVIGIVQFIIITSFTSSTTEEVVEEKVVVIDNVDIYGFYTGVDPDFLQEAKEIKQQFKPRGMSTSSVKHTLVMLHALCEEYNVSYDLAKAVISVESSWNHKAISSANAHGLMQITPIAAKDIGTSHSIMLDIYPNLIVGVQYLSKMLVRFDGDIPATLCAYNEGPSNTLKYRRDYMLQTNYFTKIRAVLADSGSALAYAH